MWCLGWDEGGKILVGVVINGYTGTSAEVSIAGGPWPRALVRATGEMVFGYLKCSRMGIATEQESVARLAMRAGARIEGKMQDYYGEGRDALLLGMKRCEWRFGE